MHHEKFGRNILSARLRPDQLKQFERITSQTGLSKSEFLRQLIDKAPILWPMAQSDQPACPVNSGGSR